MTTLIVRSSKDFENNLFGKSFAILQTDKLDTEIFNFGKILTTLDLDLDRLSLYGHIYKSDCHTPRINDKNALKKLLNQEHLGAQECPDRIDENAVRSKNTSRIRQAEELDFTGKPNFSEIPTIISEYRDGIKKYEKEIQKFFDLKENFHKNLYTMLYENSSNGTLNDFNCKKYGFKKGAMGLIKDFFQHVVKFETPYFEFKLLSELKAQNKAGYVFIPKDMPSSEKDNIKKMFSLNNPKRIIEYEDKKDVIDFLKNKGQEHTIKQQQQGKIQNN